jgi:hypothetical protein
VRSKIRERIGSDRYRRIDAPVSGRRSPNEVRTKKFRPLGPVDTGAPSSRTPPLRRRMKRSGAPFGSARGMPREAEGPVQGMLERSFGQGEDANRLPMGMAPNLLGLPNDAHRLVSGSVRACLRRPKGMLRAISRSHGGHPNRLPSRGPKASHLASIRASEGASIGHPIGFGSASCGAFGGRFSRGSKPEASA